MFRFFNHYQTEMFFYSEDDGASGASDPVAETQKEPDGPANEPDTTVEAQPNEELEALKRKLENTEKQKQLAEKAAEAAKRENALLKRSTKSEAELLEEKQRETEEMATMYKRLMAEAKAKNALSGIGLSEDELVPLIGLITTEDADKTESIALEIKTVLSLREKAVEKSIREKVMKETPAPATGGNKEPEDLFLQGFNSGRK